VGRTMSLQPSRQVVDALQIMAEIEVAEGIRALDELSIEKGVSSSMRPYSPSPRNVEGGEDKEHDADATLVEEAESDGKYPSRSDNGMNKVVFALDSPDPTSPTKTAPRSVFPSKLLARRRSSSTAARTLSTRRSEVLSGGCFRRALRAFRGEDLDSRMSMPAFPSSRSSSIGQSLANPTISTTFVDELPRAIGARPADIERYLAEIGPIPLEDDRRSSTDSIATVPSDGFAFDFPSPCWSLTNEIHVPDFDV
jgi:hypothetical protein